MLAMNLINYVFMVFPLFGDNLVSQVWPLLAVGHCYKFLSLLLFNCLLTLLQPSQAETRCHVLERSFDALDRILTWTSREAHFFRVRVLFPDLQPQPPLTSLALANLATGAVGDEGDEATSSSSSSSSSSSGSSSDSSSDSSESEPVAEEGRGQGGAQAAEGVVILKASKANVSDAVAKWAEQKNIRYPNAGHISHVQVEVAGEAAEHAHAERINYQPGLLLDRCVWKQMMAGDAVFGKEKLGGRSRILACAVTAFLAFKLLRPGLLRIPEADERYALKHLVDMFSPLLWGLPHEAAAHLREPPDEMFQSPTFDNLWSQYKLFQATVQQVAAHESHKRKFEKDEQWEDWDSHLHEALLGVKYEVACDFWHVLRLYHRVVVFGFSAESVCESAASILRYLEKRHAVGRALRTHTLVKSLMLRYYHLDGHPSTWPFVLKVVNMYFRKRKTFRFFLASRTRKSRGAVKGPSISLHKRRDKLENMSLVPVWMSKRIKWVQAKSADRHLLSSLRATELHEPDDLSAEVWQVILPALAKAGLRPFS